MGSFSSGDPTERHSHLRLKSHSQLAEAGRAPPLPAEPRNLPQVSHAGLSLSHLQVSPFFLSSFPVSEHITQAPVLFNSASLLSDESPRYKNLSIKHVFPVALQPRCLQQEPAAQARSEQPASFSPACCFIGRSSIILRFWTFPGTARLSGCSPGSSAC